MFAQRVIRVVQHFTCLGVLDVFVTPVVFAVDQAFLLNPMRRRVTWLKAAGSFRERFLLAGPLVLESEAVPRLDGLLDGNVVDAFRRAALRAVRALRSGRQRVCRRNRRIES